MSDTIDPGPRTPEARVLSTLNLDGTRRWLQPRSSPGRFHLARLVVAWLLILVFTLLPWIDVGGRPAVLLDVVRREFTIFGTMFRPTDTLLLAFLLLTFFLFIFLATAVLGRVWCGWACPQTVYMEFVYRPIERLMLGRPGSRRRAAPPVIRRLLMWAIFLVISAHLANTFLAYFVGTDELMEWTRHSPLEHSTPFLIFLATTVLMMFDFCFFREQLCTLVCPYGRLQSALLDRNSLIVGYDARRGEPRGPKRRRRPAKEGGGCDGKCGGGCSGSRKVVSIGLPTGSVELAPPPVNEPSSGCSTGAKPVVEAPAGDCIDCRACVNTCPTGIDIREGLQLECIQCAQCIDACDAMMDKVGRARGLVRFSTQDVLEQTVRDRIRWRLLIYPLLLGIVASTFIFMLLSRETADVVALRTRIAPFRILDDGSIENVIRIRIDNRGRTERAYELTAVDGDDLLFPSNPIIVGEGGSETLKIVARSDPSRFERGRRVTRIRVADGETFDRVCEFDLLGPLGSIPRRGDP